MKNFFYLGEAEQGKQNSTPFEFGRKWIVSASDYATQGYIQNSQLQHQLKEQTQALNQLKQKLYEITKEKENEETATTSKGKGKGKRKESGGLLAGLGRFMATDIDAVECQSTSGSIDSRRSSRTCNVNDIPDDVPLGACYREEPDPEPIPGQEKWLFCEKLQLEFNATELGTNLFY